MDDDNMNKMISEMEGCNTKNDACRFTDEEIERQTNMDGSPIVESERFYRRNNDTTETAQTVNLTEAKTCKSPPIYDLNSKMKFKHYKH